MSREQERTAGGRPSNPSTRHIERRRQFVRRRIAVGATAGFVVAAVMFGVSLRGGQNLPTRSAIQLTDAQQGLVAPVATPGVSLPQVPANAVTVSPEPGSRTADPRTQISVLGAPVSALTGITVTGSKSGVHHGRWEAYQSATGASFLPNRPFVPGETVTVQTNLTIVGSNNGTYEFQVAHVLHLTGDLTMPVSHTNVPGVLHFATQPAMMPPAITVAKSDPSLGPNESFLISPKGSVGQPGPMIVAPNGSLVWFDSLAKTGQLAFDLNEQRYHGQPVLTWFQGQVRYGHGQGEGIIMNNRYQVIAKVHAGNGIQMDLHEFQLTSAGQAYITAYRTVRWNLSSIGGPANATVFDGVMQEIDVATGLVMDEWDSLDHVPTTASYYGKPPTSSYQYDYFHINSIQPLAGGDILIGARNTSAAYEVDPADDGAVVFQLGGKTPSVPMQAGSSFWFQHDVQLHGGGIFTVFDDGAAPVREPNSRALFLRLSTSAKQIQYLGADTHPGVLAYALGNVEELPHGNTEVGWGTAPYYSVYSPSGALLYDAAMPQGDDSYRAYLYRWQAQPETKPAIAVANAGANLSVRVSWNGATQVQAWRLLAGPSPNRLGLVTTVPKTGFETAISVPRHPGYVRVEAVNGAGQVIGGSLPHAG